jgi:hypothetical protein
MTERFEREDDDLMAYWQQPVADDPDPRSQARRLASQITRFDRQILRRNLLEYLAGAVVVAWASYHALQGSRQALAVIAGVSFVLAYLWRAHRRLPIPDPAADGRTYRDALLQRFERQIRLLRRVRYWYLPPLYLPAVWQAAEAWPRSPWAAVIILVVVTGLFALIGWLNEVLAVRTLEQARASVQDLFTETE